MVGIINRKIIKDTLRVYVGENPIFYSLLINLQVSLSFDVIGLATMSTIKYYDNKITLGGYYE